MLIIFDLDDTLIDTSGSILPSRLQCCLVRLIESGLKVENVEEAFECLKQLDFVATSTEEALKEFFELFDVPSHLMRLALQEVYENSTFNFQVKSTPHAYEALLDLSKKHTLSIVSVGRVDIQLAKLKKAGIDTAFFSRILVCENVDKRSSYEALLQDLKVSPHEAIVCGDRVSRDLTPAKLLGCRTVHYKWGRGLNHYGHKHDVDYVITNLLEIRNILSQQELDQTFTYWDTT